MRSRIVEHDAFVDRGVGCRLRLEPEPAPTDIAPTLRFADRSDAEINALICRAASNDVLGATTIVTTFETPGDICPGVQGNAPAGGCTTSSGTAITGNVTSSSKDNSIQFDGLTLTNPTFVETWDGAVDGTWLGGSSDLTVGRAGITVRADLGYSCAALDQGDECEICQYLCTPEGSGVELVGVGDPHHHVGDQLAKRPCLVSANPLADLARADLESALAGRLRGQREDVSDRAEDQHERKCGLERAQHA